MNLSLWLRYLWYTGVQSL